MLHVITYPCRNLRWTDMKEADDDWPGNQPLPIPMMKLANMWPYGDIVSSTLAQVMACCLMAPSHYLNQYWLIVNWILRNELQWNWNQSTRCFIHENAFKNVICKMVSILFRGRFPVFLLLYCIHTNLDISLQSSGAEITGPCADISLLMDDCAITSWQLWCLALVLICSTS